IEALFHRICNALGSPAHVEEFEIFGIAVWKITALGITAANVDEEGAVPLGLGYNAQVREPGFFRHIHYSHRARRIIDLSTKRIDQVLKPDRFCFLIRLALYAAADDRKYAVCRNVVLAGGRAIEPANGVQSILESGFGKRK